MVLLYEQTTFDGDELTLQGAKFVVDEKYNKSLKTKER